MMERTSAIIGEGGAARATGVDAAGEADRSTGETGSSARAAGAGASVRANFRMTRCGGDWAKDLGTDAAHLIEIGYVGAVVYRFAAKGIQIAQGLLSLGVQRAASDQGQPGLPGGGKMTGEEQAQAPHTAEDEVHSTIAQGGR